MNNKNYCRVLPGLLITALALLAFMPVAVFAVDSGSSADAALRIITEPSGRGRLKDRHGQVYGMSTELVKAVQQQLGNTATIEILPWARAYAIAVSSDNVVLYDTIRTAEREDKFKWVGPIKIYSVDLHARKGAIKDNTSLANLLQNHVVCETRNTSIVNELLSLGFEIDKNLILSRQSGDCYNMLKLGRADLIAMHSDVTPKRQAELLDAGLDLQPVYPLQPIEIYLAFSLAVNDTVINNWQCALNKLVLQGEFRRLYQGEYADAMINEIEARAAQSQQQLTCH
ncbi:MAG: ABC transporter substrate-binding protein [Gammaproteobacteria bacterium]|nr:ABC transporter substrate-binding protein [Gammaproteobacteria bacterium]MBU1555202.1 ABC transporter substrate-binding protein [Gammaproteobacteria bacterium]MBU2071157.1 ABC transporter substrate-binding protein [Gammaproteobacteria bacterium]MBU2184393.1 ABC transporter substrate-binding protein [Gammaproteobacteria bacterium]MBU2206225.1 ABC transporter substrate-binding protein [Gammaproteobacteria bacterium]